MKFLQKILAVIACLSFAFTVQGNTPDSLLQLLKTDLPDTTRVDILGKLSMSLIGTYPDSTILYAQKAVNLAEKIADMERKAYMLKNVGLAYYYKGEFVDVLDNWRASLNTFKRINHSKGISNLLNNIGAVYYSSGDYPKAIDYYLKSLRIAEKNKDKLREGTSLQNIGAVYLDTKDNRSAQKYLLQALNVFNSINYEKGIATVSINLTDVYLNIDSLDKALAYAVKARNILEKLEDPNIPSALISIANIYNRQNNYFKAIEEAKIAYRIAEKNGSKPFLQKTTVVLGNNYNQTNQLDKAVRSFQEAIELRKSIGSNLDLQYAYEGLKTTYKLLGNYEKSSQTQDSLLEINKQLFDIEKNNKIANLQLEFNLEKRESEIALLNVDNALKSEEIAKAELQRNFFTAISLFLLALIGGVGYLYQFAKRKNKIISAQKVESDNLLKNILPVETAEELKKNGKVLPKEYDFCTVLFTDFVNFTKASANESPDTIVSSLDYYFKNFDEIITNNHLEKIKTIGDAYMCAGGLHGKNQSKVAITKNTVKAATDIIEFVEKTIENPPPQIVPFQIRIGIDSGPILAGVVGKTKFQYDIWGDTVNVASRMETNSQPNKINVSENIYSNLKDHLQFVYRGMIDVKNKGMMKMYFCN